jgi:hypothetical protein
MNTQTLLMPNAPAWPLFRCDARQAVFGQGKGSRTRRPLAAADPREVRV